MSSPRQSNSAIIFLFCRESRLNGKFLQDQVLGKEIIGVIYPQGEVDLLHIGDAVFRQTAFKPVDCAVALHSSGYGFCPEGIAHKPVNGNLVYSKHQLLVGFVLQEYLQGIAEEGIRVDAGDGYGTVGIIHQGDGGECWGSGF